MLEFLLKYNPVVFSEGEITFKLLPSIIALLGTVILFAVALWLIYRKTTLQLNRKFKTVLIGLKFVVITLLLIILLEPVVTVSSVVPRKSSLILLVDDSKSMSIQDAEDDLSRLDFTKRLLGSEEAPGLTDRLKQNFKIQMYKFSSDVEHLKETQQLAAQGVATNLARSLAFAVDVAKQSAVSGVVLFTDGVNNGDDDPLEYAAVMKNKNLPVFVVGVGSERSEDIELSKVAVNHSVIENSVIELSALIKNKSLEKKKVELELREEGRIVKKQTVNLEGAATRTSLKFSPQKSGFVRYSLNVVAQENESIKENNSKSFLIDNRSKRARVLYIDGYPRAEFKYLRRAIDGDPSLELVSLLRTSQEKFYRQGIKDQSELRDGYPKNKKELFEYDAIIFGSIEADFFSSKELENTLEFVSQRGGGFLMLGGSQTFGQGNYYGTPVEKMLPVELPYRNSAVQQFPGTFRDKFKLLLTPEGYRNPILQLASTESESRNLWDALPDLEGYNPLGRAKPGATILAVHPLSEAGDPKVILAQQRFGRGRSMVFATSSSWLWQMGLSHEDMSHERFWRQILRWLALASPEPIECHLDKETYVPNDEVTLKVDVRDSTFSTIEDATIKARITTPSGKIIDVPFNWSSNGKVEYIGAYHPDEQGLYLVEITARSSNGSFLGKTEAAFFVEESTTEFSNAQLQAPLLKRIAEISGGKYYHQDEAESLPDQISVMQGTYSKLVEYDLWDMPLLFLLLILILSVEWYLRRSKGLS
ncbi:VWA domain-containing protein [candidate division KSB1 bacterium]|nr:VWA domain-containing protein [candidate division KSB1 bacterium]